MSEWQPIETAPRDHSAILIAVRVNCGWFITSARYWSGDWWTRNIPDENGLIYPTHWMPLPEPPK